MSPEALPRPPRASASGPEDPYVADLLDLIKETKSVDAFLVTVSLLAETKGEKKRFIPAVIRNAERLGIYERFTIKEQEPGAQAAALLTGLIDRLKGGEANAEATRLFDPPLSMGLQTPIPLPPWVEERVTEKLKDKANKAVPVLPPIPPGHRPLCEDSPDQAAILRALPRVTRGAPYIYEEFRDDFDFTVERLVDAIDPPRFYPLIGPAQLHHCHYKCTVHYTETLESAYPSPFRCQRRRTQVVYIDKDYFHRVGGDPDVESRVYPPGP
jgi:hypothetical protein